MHVLNTGWLADRESPYRWAGRVRKPIGVHIVNAGKLAGKGNWSTDVYILNTGELADTDFPCRGAGRVRKPIGVHILKASKVAGKGNPSMCMSWTQVSWQTQNLVHTLKAGKLADKGDPLMRMSWTQISLQSQNPYTGEFAESKTPLCAHAYWTQVGLQIQETHQCAHSEHRWAHMHRIPIQVS